jgi:hypothetical protein
MRFAIILGFGVLGFFLASPAQALTISNTDPDPHTVIVKTGGDSTELTIEPDTAVEPPCGSGCIVELENGEQYELQGGEEVSIEGGTIFVDAAPGVAGEGEDATGSTEPGEGEPQDSASAHPDGAAQAE